MSLRTDFQEILEQILESDNVYFQPPESLKLKYPCIIYERSDVKMDYAGDSPYKHKKQYKVTIIDKDPDSAIPDKISMLPLCNFDRHYTANNLNHDVYNIYY